MREGDLVRNKATGRLFVVTAVGSEEEKEWITVFNPLHPNIIYHAEFFEVISPNKGVKDEGQV
tara:strand:+ start:299 stop:487 length:189 start_codon:yes stop_codon:yes gene_type:complete